MDTNKVIGLLLATCLVAPMASANPAKMPCVMLSKERGTVVEISGKPITTPVRLDDCRNVRVISGRVAVCFVSSNGTRTCKTLQSGQHVSEEDAALAGTQTLGNAVLSMLQGGTATQSGQTRAPSGTLGFPYGAILGLDPVLTVRPDNSGLTQFELYDVARPEEPLGRFPVSAPIVIPLDRLTSQATYRWVATIGDRRYSGMFLLAGREADSVRNQASRINSDSNLTPIEKDFLIADLLDQEGFLFERDQLTQSLINEISASP